MMTTDETRNKWGEFCLPTPRFAIMIHFFTLLAPKRADANSKEINN